MTEIIPTILTKDLLDLQKKIQAIGNLVPRVQIDVVDGIFAHNKTFSLEALKDFEHSLKMELHLMVKEPIDWINRSRDVVADRIVAQVEMMSDIGRFLEEVASSGLEVGLALDLKTEVEKVPAEIYPRVDSVLLMAVSAGLGGQEFDSKVLEKIKKIKEIVGDLVEVGVDGGLDEENILKCKKAGANIFYVGGTFWEANDLHIRYEELLKLVN